MDSPSSSTPSPPPPLSPKAEPKPAFPPKKTAPLPWSHPETLALIQAYQEKWYSAKRGPLKSYQWEEISVTVAARCGFDDSSRTSTQCRHKMEKLRKRYRSDLQKPYPNSWQYFDLMDQLKRGPMPLTARPIAIVKSSSSPDYVNNNFNNGANHGYGTNLYSGSLGYLNKNNNSGDGDGGGSDESDEDWNNKGYGVETAAKKNKSRSGFRAAKTVNGKRKKYYDDADSDEYEDGDDLKDKQKTGVDDEMGEESGGGGGVETELAAEIRGFAERFMRMEGKKIEMMRETERYWMETEKKRRDMILENHRKIISSIGSAFGAHKKGKMVQES